MNCKLTRWILGILGCLLTVLGVSSAANEADSQEPTAPAAVMQEEYTPGSWTLAVLPD
jgi:hypothetical protein